jgi:DNA-binding NtrC family response regulator
VTQAAPKSAFHGECEAIRAFAERLERAAASEATVLIVGEPGSGKTRAARWLHELSPRSAGPLAVVQPAALSPTLLEAELFGHEVGAFTGADRARLGRFRGASGGTLVLDGVEDLPASLQVKLLRVLQERVVEPVGSAEPVPVDARIVATSRVPLEAEVEAGRFREDLLYRLAVVPLVVPPLRARRADLELLVEEVGRGLGASLAEPRPFCRAAWELLEAHRWPGNLAELENLVLRLGVLGTPGSEVLPEELAELSEAPAGPDPAQRLAEEALDLGLQVGDIEAAMVRGALARTRGNASAAARALGLTRKALEYRRARLEADERGGES